MSEYVDQLLTNVALKNPHEPEFRQAVEEVMESVELVLERHPEYREAKVVERIVEPERVIQFRVPWVDDAGEVHVNRGFRIEMNSTLGPYKGGLRFHPAVYIGKLKFLAFEQIFKNALTTLPMGAGKGGADFDPKGKTDTEVMRFCQAFMTELQRHIGPDTDVPAGDIGVGGREIGFLYGQYKRIRNVHAGGVLTGKGVGWGGSLIRPEATGYGAVYFAEEMLATRDESLEGKRCLVSGSGNVAQYTVEKLLDLSAIPITLSDTGGFIHDPDGIDREKLAWVMTLKNERRGRMREYAEAFPRATFTPADAGDTNALWSVPADCAFPSAIENEINEKDAVNLANGGVKVISEGANMPTTPNGVQVFFDMGVMYGPGKAANAGGVAVSGLEMSQNSMRVTWDRDVVDDRLRTIMKRIHQQCRETAEDYGKPGSYFHGANIAGFTRVADAMLAQGVI
ncbi:MAG: NADP-specific glutamate dehydrogenase [Actinomycetota bacterium]